MKHHIPWFSIPLLRVEYFPLHEAWYKYRENKLLVTDIFKMSVISTHKCQYWWARSSVSTRLLQAMTHMQQKLSQIA